MSPARLRLAPGTVTALYAALCTSGNDVTPDGILRLTPRQIHEIYQHPRDKDGKVIVPEQPTAPEAPSLEGQLARIHAMAQLFKLPADQVRQAEAVLRAKYGNAG